ncbi:MAG: aspartyl-tRNA(Asn)/glutamyl-tRNA(Gln) amidotransferase subunit [Patescibacteria group bacterium]|nr:aspartyl-tRNA(Asn)/glutamyl-tRNA(Gln) amidotransferase subunit [Patescibacteria group bacterium]
MEYETVIGLEIHAELKTKTKMFCKCLNNAEETVPNKNICPVCLAHPGTLPVINKKAVELVLKVGLALGSTIPEFSKFDRKNYFYPDLPKGYQISQYDQPLCQGGSLSLYLSDDLEESTKEITLTRIHLEEDTGKLIHPADGKSTLIDFNRAGVPLMELVTEPVLHNGKEARLFCQGLQLLLKTLAVSEAEMEKGQMRCEVNISLAPKSKVKSQKLGTKVEIKNLNSFKAVEEAIDYEIQRQRELLEKGEKVVQETRGWDEARGKTYSQRIKEEAQDYRYFPEPDLPPLTNISKTFDLEKLKAELPELPWEKKRRIIKQFTGQATIGLTTTLERKPINIFLEHPEYLQFYEDTINELKNEKIELKKAQVLARNYFLTDIIGFMEKEKIKWEDSKLIPLYFAKIISYLVQDKISSRVAKDILLEIIRTGKDPEKLIKEQNLETISDIGLIKSIIEEVIKNNPKAVQDYRNGKETALQFLVGQAMARLKGAANPQELGKLIREKITG